MGASILCFPHRPHLSAPPGGNQYQARAHPMTSPVCQVIGRLEGLTWFQLTSWHDPYDLRKNNSNSITIKIMKQTRQCWPTVYHASPTLNQYWVNVSVSVSGFLGYCIFMADTQYRLLARVCAWIVCLIKTVQRCSLCGVLSLKSV